MTDVVDVAALRVLLDAATPGPWEAVQGSTDGVWIEAPNTSTIAHVDCDYSGNPTEDAALIAAAVNALPVLLAEIEASREKLARAVADEQHQLIAWLCQHASILTTI